MIIGSTKSKQLGKNITIYGKITSRGNNIPYAKIFVNVADKQYNTTANKNGYYKIIVTASKAGNNTIKAHYNGSAKYLASNVSTYCNVIDIYNVIIDTPEQAKNASKLSLRVYVTPNNIHVRKTINTGIVTIKINNQTLTSNVNYGKAIIRYKLPAKTGTYNITAKYNDADELTSYVYKKVIKVTSADISKSKSAILGNKNPKTTRISLTDGIPNLVYMTNYVWADENATYTLSKSQIEEVFKQDSYCLYLNKGLSEYVAFKTLNESNIYHVLTREKWNVIEKAVNKVRVSSNKGSIPDNITVSLAGKEYTYGEARAIQSTEFTCGPTSASVCSQTLKNYVNEYTFATEFNTYRYHGTYAKYIPIAMKKHNMTATYFYKSSFNNALNQLANCECTLIFYGVNHYVSILDISADKTKVLVSNSYGNYDIGGGKIPNGWVSVTLMKNRFSSDSFGGLIVKLNYSLSSSSKTQVNNLYNNFGTKWMRKNTDEELNV